MRIPAFYSRFLCRLDHQRHQPELSIPIYCGGLWAVTLSAMAAFISRIIFYLLRIIHPELSANLYNYQVIIVVMTFAATYFGLVSCTLLTFEEWHYFPAGVWRRVHTAYLVQMGYDLMISVAAVLANLLSLSDLGILALGTAQQDLLSFGVVISCFISVISSYLNLRSSGYEAYVHMMARSQLSRIR